MRGRGRALPLRQVGLTRFCPQHPGGDLLGTAHWGGAESGLLFGAPLAMLGDGHSQGLKGQEVRGVKAKLPSAPFGHVPGPHCPSLNPTVRLLGAAYRSFRVLLFSCCCRWEKV